MKNRDIVFNKHVQSLLAIGKARYQQGTKQAFQPGILEISAAGSGGDFFQAPSAIETPKTRKCSLTRLFNSSRDNTRSTLEDLPIVAAGAFTRRSIKAVNRTLGAARALLLVLLIHNPSLALVAATILTCSGILMPCRLVLFRAADIRLCRRHADPLVLFLAILDGLIYALVSTIGSSHYITNLPTYHFPFACNAPPGKSISIFQYQTR